MALTRCRRARDAQEQRHTFRLADRLDRLADRGCKDRDYQNSVGALRDLAEAIRSRAAACDLHSLRAVQATNLARRIAGYRGRKGTAVCEGVQRVLPEMWRHVYDPSTKAAPAKIRARDVPREGSRRRRRR